MNQGLESRDWSLRTTTDQRNISAQPIQLIPVLEPRDARLCEDVVNLSNTRLSRDQLRVLYSSSKFRIAPKVVPYMQLIAGVECIARRLDQGDVGLVLDSVQ